MVESVVPVSLLGAGTGELAGRGDVDRCPGTLVVHAAADGGLARVRIPGGRLAADTLAALGDWARELGNGRLELTGRGNLQLRGLSPGAESPLSRRLAARGLLPSLSHDRVRNVLASPLSGRDDRGRMDVRPLVGELDRRLCADSALAELPGRFLFALDDGRGDVATSGADVAVRALSDHQVELLLAGRRTGLRLAPRAAVTGLLAAAAAFLRRRPDRRVWRVHELPGGPSALAAELAGTLSTTPGPRWSAADREPPPAEPRSVAPPVGSIEQTDGRVALVALVPLGELTPPRCRSLASVAPTEVILTPWRRVVLPDLSPSQVVDTRRRLAASGLVLDPTASLLGVSACTGRPGCAQALADVRADASVPEPGPPPVPGDSAREPLAVHWSGCARRCGRPGGPVVDVVAEQAGYRVWRDDQVYFTGGELDAVRAAVARARVDG